MSMHKKPGRGQTAAQRRRRVRVYGDQREQPDLRKLSRAVIAMAQAEAEREAQAEHQSNRRARGQEND